jgi:cytoskeleton protein RodZ
LKNYTGGAEGIGLEKQMQKTNGPGDKKNQGARPGCAGSIGAYMRDKRISRDIGTEEVSAATGISTTVLQALENDDRENLPAEVYIKAFYKKYAEYLGLDFAEVQAKYQQQAQSLKKTRRRFDFNTVVTLKGHGGSIFTETLRRLFLPMAILLLGILLYWIYKNYLAPYNPLGFYQDHFPAFHSLLSANTSDFFC